MIERMSYRTRKIIATIALVVFNLVVGGILIIIFWDESLTHLVSETSTSWPGFGGLIIVGLLIGNVLIYYIIREGKMPGHE
jgi:drug/metabolite transporter (DMT)-like permease